MANVEQSPPVQVGDPAPDFTLPACNRDGMVALADFRGKAPLLLVLDRGLYCPFCRRHLVQLGATCEKLREVGVETLAVTAAPAERARLYLRMRPTRVPVAADPERASHRAYGLPSLAVTPELVQMLREVKIDPLGELPVPVPVAELNQAYNRLDQFEMTDADQEGLHRHMTQAVEIVGQFLVDPDGVVRWRNVECERDGMDGAGKFPSDEELLAAARSL
jgi:peroxiredoxin